MINLRSLKIKGIINLFTNKNKINDKFIFYKNKRNNKFTFYKNKKNNKYNI